MKLVRNTPAFFAEKLYKSMKVNNIVCQEYFFKFYYVPLTEERGQVFSRSLVHYILWILKTRVVFKGAVTLCNVSCNLSRNRTKHCTV